MSFAEMSGAVTKDNSADALEEGMIASPPATPRSRLTALKAFVVKLMVASVGDCRAVLSDGGRAIPLSNPHKPCLATEKSRIEAAGGWVHRDRHERRNLYIPVVGIHNRPAYCSLHRVNGVLAVSRSFGDIMYKKFPPTSASASEPSRPPDWSTGAGLWDSDQQVISEPEVVDMVVQPTFEFLVLASDGLWDVMSPDECVNFVRRRLNEHKDCQRAAIELVAKAEGRGTADNTSVVVCGLNQVERTSVRSTRSNSAADMTPPVPPLDSAQSSPGILSPMSLKSARKLLENSSG
eukprot:gene4875-6207_t